MHFKEMIPGLGEKYGITVEVISKPREEYAGEAYSKLGLPVAPAIMIGEQVLVEKIGRYPGRVRAGYSKSTRNGKGMKVSTYGR